MKGLNTSETVLAVLIGVAFAAIIYAACVCLSGWIFMLLWNWIAAGVFHAPVLTYWQGVGCTMLLSFIGGAFRSVTTKK